MSRVDEPETSSEETVTDAAGVTRATRLRNLKMRSVAVVLLWLAIVLLTLFRGPLWFILLCGAVGAVLVFWDYGFVREGARELIFGKTKQ